MRTSESDAELAAGRPFSGRRRAISENTTQRQGASDFRQEGKTKASQKCGHAFEKKRCLTCEAEFRAIRSWQLYCSDECKFVYRAARTLLQAIREGRADGLKLVIEELKRS